MPMREPPLVSNLLFESPWPIVVVLVVIALGLGIAGSRRGNGRLQLAAVTMLLLAAGAWLLAWTVTTDREAVSIQTHRLVEATAPLDVAALDQLLAEDAIITGPDGSVWYDWAAAQNLLERTIDRWPIEDQAIRGLAAEADGNTARTAIDLRTTSASLGLPMTSTWMIHWRRTPQDTWEVREIQWLTLQGEEPSKGTWP